MAHNNSIPNDIINGLFELPKVKKVFILEHEVDSLYKKLDHADLSESLKNERLSKSAFLSIPERENGVIYEIIRDEYFR